MLRFAIMDDHPDRVIKLAVFNQENRQGPDLRQFGPQTGPVGQRCFHGPVIIFLQKTTDSLQIGSVCDGVCGAVLIRMP